MTVAPDYRVARAPEGRPGAWLAGPARPRTEEGAAHVWRADLAQTGKAALPTLSPAERERAERFRSPDRGRLWARSRVILRELLGRYMDADPKAVALRADPAGRLVVPGSRAISFSLAHSGSVAVYAFTGREPVGIDVEIGAGLKAAALARRLFGPADAMRVAALAPPERRREVLRAWVQREALLKCSSAGGSEPWVFELEAWPGVSCALAVASTRCATVSCWEFS